MLMFEAFKASAKRVEDIAGALGFDDGLPVHGGFVFDNGGGFIEDNTSTDPKIAAMGKFYLLIERSDWISDDFDKLAKILWAFHYLWEATEVVELRGADLSHFVDGYCAGVGAVVDPAVFGNAFRDRAKFSPREAADRIVLLLHG